MTAKTEDSPQPSHDEDSEFVVPEEAGPTAFDRARFNRARMHVTSLGDVKVSDAFKQYKRPWLAPFFGENVPDAYYKTQTRIHPCTIFSHDVHRCLKARDNSYGFCQSHVAVLQKCLRDFKL